MDNHANVVEIVRYQQSRDVESSEMKRLAFQAGTVLFERAGFIVRISDHAGIPQVYSEGA